MNVFEKDIEESLGILKAGGVLLYPTDTIWDWAVMLPIQKL
jgi:tRNA A37 threonylcarbamoyladenosine synthetase subunit TsaC/SUA5/YrdC